MPASSCKWRTWRWGFGVVWVVSLIALRVLFSLGTTQDSGPSLPVGEPLPDGGRLALEMENLEAAIAEAEERLNWLQERHAELEGRPGGDEQKQALVAEVAAESAKLQELVGRCRHPLRRRDQLSATVAPQCPSRVMSGGVRRYLGRSAS